MALEYPPINGASHIDRNFAARGDDVDDRSAVSSVTHGSLSTSSSALVSLVKKQVSIVRNLTSANKDTSDELQKVQEEKRRIEEEYKKMKEQMRSPISQPDDSGAVEVTLEKATVLGSIPENSANGDYWASEDRLHVPASPVVPSPHSARGSHANKVFPASKVEMLEDGLGLGPRATAVPSMPPNTYWDVNPLTQDPSLSNIRQMDEWSVVAYPSARNVVVAEPVGHIGTEPHAKSEQQRKKRKKKKRSTAPIQPPKKTIPLASTDPAPELKVPEKKDTCSSRFWASFSQIVTFFIPDFLICRDGPQAKQAWREKVAIFVLMIFFSAVTVGLFGFLPLFLCQPKDQFSWVDIHNQNNNVLTKHREAWTVIHGHIYDVKPFIDIHTGGADAVRDFLGEDASKFFPRTPAGILPEKCLNPDAALTNLTKPECNMFDEVDHLLGRPCHDFATGIRGVDKYMGKYHRGILVYSLSVLSSQDDFDWIVIRGTVYNVTSYMESPVAYLNSNLTNIIKFGRGTDATNLFEALYAPEVADNFQLCLDHLFFQGEVDDRADPVCDSFNVVMYIALIIVASILVLQCLCSLFYVIRKPRTLTSNIMKNHVMVMIPCYNEGDKELRKTIKSVLDTEYPDDNKVMLVVADGIITGRGEACSTPETVAKMLGYTMDKTKDPAHLYKSIGAYTRNRAFVYHGTHKKDGRELKYIVVVKCGTSKERNGPRPGNRGKRDSQLIVTGLLNRVHYGRELNELDIAICRALNELDVSIEELKYLMAIDADTRVHKDSMAQMVYSMEKKENILACCGETRVDNKAQGWVTMIQVYEYYSSHHMKKAFESLFGTVTCLPGCFTMYRIRSNDNRPLIACDYVFGEYARNDIESLHEKNLYHLGEDRMLTTLLLTYFSDMRLSFVPEAVCWTIVPHTFKILLSQRRRWINSTFHNMWELLKVRTMCGVCFCSMKTVVVADMLSCMILPASLVYAGYFVYRVIVEGEPISTTLVIVYAVIIGCQMIIFVIRSRWDYFFWFFAFLIIGVPVFYFILPLYAFWRMDDLSWGQTRQVAGDSKSMPQKDAVIAMDGSATHQSRSQAADQAPSAAQSSTRSPSTARDSQAARSLTKDQSPSRQSPNQSSQSGQDQTRRMSCIVEETSNDGSRVTSIELHEV